MTAQQLSASSPCSSFRSANSISEDEDSRDPSSGEVSALAIQSTITIESLGTCLRHLLGLLQDIDNLQKTLSSNGEDPSEHQQSLIGSYFRARGHLDSVLLGNPQRPKDNPRSTDEERTKSEIGLTIHKPLTGSTIHNTESRTSREIEERARLTQEVRKEVDRQATETRVAEEKQAIKAKLTTEKSEQEVRKGQNMHEDQRKVKLEAEQRAEIERQIKAIKQAVENKPQRGVRLQYERDETRMSGQDDAQRMRKEAEVRAREEQAKEKWMLEQATTKSSDETAVKKAAEEAAVKKAVEEFAAKKAAEEAKIRTKQQPILFKDAIGRKFSFPFHLCATWQVRALRTPC